MNNNLNSTPSANRTHIGIFGRRNAGKSSLINAITNQDIALVSNVKGTTTDPVYKAMELLPLGPVVIIDTPGIDDVGELGEKRIERSLSVLKDVDIALIVVDSTDSISLYEDNLVDILKSKSIPYLIVYNKSDLVESELYHPVKNENSIVVSSKDGTNIHSLKEKIANLIPKRDELDFLSDLIEMGDLVLLVTPIDESAPKGRLILPQQQIIRNILDLKGISIVCQVDEVTSILNKFGDRIKLVITDSKVFSEVSKLVDEDIPLTSFSILFARNKGILKYSVESIDYIDKLNDGDSILIAEGCTHHRQCDDIGTVRIPNALKKYTGKDLSFTFTSGKDFSEELSDYSLIIQCGACMLKDSIVLGRLNEAVESGIPFTNFGIFLAHMNGILSESISMFGEL